MTIDKGSAYPFVGCSRGHDEHDVGWTAKVLVLERV